MEIEVLKMFIQYGLAGLVMAFVLIWFARYLLPKVDANSKDIQALTLALTVLTQSVNNLSSTTQSVFDDNRHTIQILLQHIEQKEGK